MTALLGKIPGIAWVIALGLLLLAGATWAVFAAGRRAGVTAVHRTALVDSARVAHAAVDSATRRTDGTVQQSRNWVTKSSGARDRWELQREAAIAELERSPAPVVALVASARTTIAQQDTTIHVLSTALDAYAAERAARVRADTVEAHQLAIGAAQDDGHGWRCAAAIVAVAGAVWWKLSALKH